MAKIKIDWFKERSNEKLRELYRRLNEAISDVKVRNELPPDLLEYINTENKSHRKPQYLIDIQNEGHINEGIGLDGKEHWGLGNTTTRIVRCLNLIDQEVLIRFRTGKIN
jgi:hypothetical protein